MRHYERRLQNRRGATLVLAGLMLVTLLIMLAVVVDISKLQLQRNELQTTADAAAHAGAIELSLRDSTGVADTAVAYAARTKVVGHTITYPQANIVCGVWNPTTSTFTTSANSGRCGDSANAVQSTGQDSSHYFFKSILTSAGVLVNTTATAWVSSSVAATSCIRPWSMPYWTLTKLVDPTNPDTTRNLTAYDLHQLATLTTAQLTFSLKSGSPPTAPGNFGPVDIGGTGAEQYRTNIETCNSTPVGPGDVLDTETGNMKGPTVQGAGVLCQPYYGNGACGNGKGGIGLTVKVPLWVTATTVNGKTSVTVKIIGSFSLDTVSSDARVVGHWIKAADEGTIGTTPGTLVRVILVK